MEQGSEEQLLEYLDDVAGFKESVYAYIVRDMNNLNIPRFNYSEEII